MVQMGTKTTTKLTLTEILMLSWVPLPAFVLLLLVAVVVDPLDTLTCPNAIAIGLGDESGDDVSEEIYLEYDSCKKKDHTQIMVR